VNTQQSRSASKPRRSNGIGADAYDTANRLSTVTDWNSNATNYAYDDANRMTTAALPNGVVSSYAYDNADRMTSVTPPSPASVVSYTWDNNGDLTARGSDSFSWDYEDRMTSATVGGTTWSYAYRGDGLRDSATSGLCRMTTSGTADLLPAATPLPMTTHGPPARGRRLKPATAGQRNHALGFAGLISLAAGWELQAAADHVLSAINATRQRRLESDHVVRREPGKRTSPTARRTGRFPSTK